MSRARSRRTLVAALAPSLAALLAAIAGGCQSYRPDPVDVPRHHAAFLARSAQSAEVRAFAESLAPREFEGAAFDPTDGVSCGEAELIALVFNADLGVARLRAGATKASADNAGLWEDPTLGVDLARILDGTPHPWKAFGNLGLTIPLSGRLEAEKARATAEHAAELERLAQREWETRMELRRAWANWSALRVQLDATREFVGRADQVLGVVDTMERAGEMPRTEARLFRIEKAAKSADLALLESRVREAELGLKRIMGLAPDAPVALVAGAACEPVDRGGDLATRAQSSPVVRVALAEHEVAEKALAREIRAQYPDLELAPGFGREDDMDQVLLGLSVPLPILNANRRGIAEARAQRDITRAGVEAALEGTIAMVRAAEERIDAAARRREAIEREIVPLVDAQYADARELASLGEVNTLVLLESLTRQHDTKRMLIEARAEESLAAIDLAEILGPPSEIKGTHDECAANPSRVQANPPQVQANPDTSN